MLLGVQRGLTWICVEQRLSCVLIVLSCRWHDKQGSIFRVTYLCFRKISCLRLDFQLDQRAYALRSI